MLVTSETLTSITPALINARKAIGPLLKDATAKGSNFSYNYATLDQLIELVTQPLLDNDIILLQSVAADGAENGEPFVAVSTRLQHASGEYLETLRMFTKVEDRKGLSLMQSAGMNVTYSRRYQLMSLLGLAAEEDTDAGISNSNARASLVRDMKAGYPSREERGPSQREEDNEPFIPY